jgi:hypothetical protein
LERDVMLIQERFAEYPLSARPGVGSWQEHAALRMAELYWGFSH